MNKESIKKFLAAVAIIAGVLALLIVDGKLGESGCESDSRYDQTTGKCIDK